MNHDLIEIGHLIGIDLTLEICLNESASLNLMWSFFPVRSPGDFKALRTSDVPAISLLASCLLAHRFYAAWRTRNIQKQDILIAITVTTSTRICSQQGSIFLTSTITSYIYLQLFYSQRPGNPWPLALSFSGIPRWRHAGPRDATIGVWEHLASGPVAGWGETVV